MVKQATKEALILILAAVGISFAVYVIRPDKIGVAPAVVNPGNVRQSPADSGFSEITMEDAVRLYEKKGAIFADSRHAADFEAGHIKGAVHLYAADQEIWLHEFLAAIDPEKVIITYCDGEDCHLAQALAELLSLNGFDNVRYLRNGWTRWRDGGFPVE